MALSSWETPYTPSPHSDTSHCSQRFLALTGPGIIIPFPSWFVFLFSCRAFSSLRPEPVPSSQRVPKSWGGFSQPAPPGGGWAWRELPSLPLSPPPQRPLQPALLTVGCSENAGRSCSSRELPGETQPLSLPATRARRCTHAGRGLSSHPVLCGWSPWVRVHSRRVKQEPSPTGPATPLRGP